MQNNLRLDQLGILISDNEGNLRNVDEIISELQGLYDGWDTHSMNDSALYLQGQKDMILNIINYLKRIA
jgi:hypothetical protein